MRKDIFTARWVIVADGDGVQPTDFHFKKFARDTSFCPFCESHEAATPPEVFAIRNPASSPKEPLSNHRF
jgi:galactose-1-phosphate uridylyltransferase